MVKKLLTILTSALMVLAAFAGGGVSSLLTATPVMAEGEPYDVTFTVNLSDTETYYPFVFTSAPGTLTGASVVLNGTTLGTISANDNAEAVVGNNCDILIPLHSGDVLEIQNIPNFTDASDSLIAAMMVHTLFDPDSGDFIDYSQSCDYESAWLNSLLSNLPTEQEAALLTPLTFEASGDFMFDELFAGYFYQNTLPSQISGDFVFQDESFSPAPAPSSDFAQYTAVAGDNDIPLNKYLVLAEDAQVPNATFSFAIAAGTGVPASTGVQEVLAPTAANGVGGSAPTIASISYTASDTASMTDAADAGVTLSFGQKYVKKTTYVDFSSTTFAEPGIYRYVITESGANGVEAIFNMDAQKGQGATAKQRILDVYVTDANDGTNVLSISEYVLHELADNVPTGSDMGTGYASLPIADKSVGYVNVFLSQNLGVANKTDGNQGSRDKYFAYTVALTGLQGEKAYDVDISNADAEVASTVATAQGYRGNSNPTSLTSLANGSASGTFYLRDDQNIEIKGLPVGVGYTVTAVAEDYKQTAGATITAGTFTDSATGTIASADINTGYTHTRNGVIPTGIAVSAAGTIAIAGFAVAGLFAKRKREDEE